LLDLRMSSRSVCGNFRNFPAVLRRASKNPKQKYR
jgi:hypothetical protein